MTSFGQFMVRMSTKIEKIKAFGTCWQVGSLNKNNQIDQSEMKNRKQKQKNQMKQ